MKFPRFSLSKKWLIVPPVLLGGAAIAFAVSSKAGPEQAPPKETARPLPVAVAAAETVEPVVTGYGVARPARVWRAVAQVDGTVLETHPDLDGGCTVAAGDVLIRVEPTDYELAVSRLEAELASLAAQLAETERQRENDEDTLKIELKSLELARAELARYRRLTERGASSQSETERVERDVLRQLRTAQSLKSGLALVPAKLDRLRAASDAAKTQLEQARRDLERTTITAPFDARVAAVSIEAGQYVGPNEPLFELHGIDTYEIEVRVPLDETDKLVRRSPGDPSAALGGTLDGLPATVRVSSGDWSRDWDGRVSRVRELVDRRTRTLGLVVTVENPTDGGAPLLEGTFAEVEIVGPARYDQLVLPAAAVRDGTALVVDADGRLRRRDANLAFRLGDRVALVRGPGAVRPGERVVVGDAAPSVEGSLVRPISADTEPNRSVDESARLAARGTGR